MFLAVDWALMTDIIPKASSGRYMGLSNVATASAGVLAIAVGGTLMDVVGGPGLDGSGPRAALWMAVVLMGIGALLLRPVDERRREDVARAGAVACSGAGAPASAGAADAREPGAVASPAPPGRRPQEVERIGPPVEPRHEGPQVDEVVEPDRPRAEPEQRLELDDRQRQGQDAEPDRDRQPEEAPLLRAPGQDRPGRRPGTHFIQVASAHSSPPSRGPVNCAAHSISVSCRLMLPVSRFAPNGKARSGHDDRRRQRPPAVGPVDRPEQQQDRPDPPDEPGDVPRQERPRREERQHPRARRRTAGTGRSGGTGRRR